MRMKALKSFRGRLEGVQIKRGQEFDQPNEKRCRELEMHGLAVPASPHVTFHAGPTVEPRAAVIANEAADAGPLAAAGGETGAAGSASSSPAAPAPRTRRSRGPRTAPES